MALRIARPLLAAAEFPTPAQPLGTGVVFEHVLPVKYALSGPKWCAVVASGLSGAFAGNFFFKNCIMRKNPPNPPRDPNERPPERHPHAPEEE
ncbi:hypothetical protein, conserved [Eimeria acervulina]|uniref:Uncharacterized protein n=1 Tax=Eimeria acervulina TaxID=5801 RepID=U6GUK1_EIMAC|nr:hypothetical protein, conserved [Eimeria acervulina]CDI82244.1 hypothetical protein, conserved [Eimeria acervulina]